jgi:predicted adenylyl cyclase CyaB
VREVEVKAVCDDLPARRQRVEKAGARLVYEGRLVDRRYDIESRELADRDEVLRVRRYESGAPIRTYLDWKGRTGTQGPYKIREELSTLVEDFTAIELILEKIGFVVTMEIDREIAQYELGAATIRFETYPRMDILVEVEGAPEAIDQAIESLGMLRGEFTSERLPTFVSRFEKRTGVRAAICDRELTGDSQYRRSDA